MADRDHKLMSTPVSVNDGLRRADGSTWKLLGISFVAAILIVIGINLFVPKSKVAWPDSMPKPAAAPADPRTHDVAPPARPQPNQ